MTIDLSKQRTPDAGPSLGESITIHRDDCDASAHESCPTTESMAAGTTPVRYLIGTCHPTSSRTAAAHVSIADGEPNRANAEPFCHPSVN